MPLPDRAKRYLSDVESAIDGWISVPPDSVSVQLDPYLVLAIMDRESLCGDALTPPGPTGTGDSGHGRGLMQLDDRAHPDLVDQELPDGTPCWMIPAYNIQMGVGLLHDNLKTFGGNILAAIAAYNASPSSVWRALDHLEHQDDASQAMKAAALDLVCTPNDKGIHDYVSDVLARRDRFMTPEISQEATPNA